MKSFKVKAELHQIRQQHAQRQRDHGGGDKPGESLGADAAGGLAVAQVGNPHGEGGKHQQRDDHLDQAQEDVGHQRDVGGNIGGEFLVGEHRVAGVADGNAEQHREQDVEGEGALLLHTGLRCSQIPAR
jgi:hypothetical protein